MKNAKKVLSPWFWSWIGISTVLVILMMTLGAGNASALHAMASTIMALFMLLPIRDWMYRLLCWAIDYVSSINTNFKDRINPHATYNRLIDSTKREENVGFYRTLKIVLGIITLILALLWMVFQKTSFEVVFSFLHTIEFLFRGKISWLALLTYLLLTLGFYYGVYWFIGQVLEGSLYVSDGRFDWKSWWKVGLAIIGFYLKIILSGLLLCYTSSMIWASIRFWTIVVGFPLLLFEIWRVLRKRHPSTP